MENGLRSVVWFPIVPLVVGVACKQGDRIGQACDLTVDAGLRQAVANMQANGCRTGLCLKPAADPGAAAVDPPTGATCTDECTSDSDCDGELRVSSDPLDTRCKGGFVCGVPFAVGPLCCKHYCLCKDFLGAGGFHAPTACQGPDALASCENAAGNAAAAVVGQEVDAYVNVPHAQELDLVFMVDNSPSMAPKLSKLKQQFPKMLEVFRDPTDRTYADLRIAIIDSDLGTGGAYQSGACGTRSGSGASNSFGDLGDFQMRGAADCGANADALWLEYANGRPLSFGRTIEIGQAFACLAGNLGAAGCSEEHQLQSLELALVAQDLHQGPRGRLQSTFLRKDAYLVLVIMSDEDDCSAATNDGMFGPKPELRAESTSLRCATRGHRCGGINLTDAPPGYPATAKFEASFVDCAARTDACPNATDGNGVTDTSRPTDCSPLKDIHHLAQKIKALKAHPEEQILVSGIFGWPRLDARGTRPDLAHAKYKIDLVPAPRAEDIDNQQGPLWDLWPVCFDPDHEPSDPDKFDADAWAWGAQGGLRISAFIDEFGANGLKTSICERDFSRAISPFSPWHEGTRNVCADAKLMDVDPTAPGLQPDCRVVYRVPETDPTTGEVRYTEAPRSLPICPSNATSDTVASDCWQVVIDYEKCPGVGQLITVVRTAAEIADSPLPAGTKTVVQCWACPDSASRPGCDY